MSKKTITDTKVIKELAELMVDMKLPSFYSLKNGLPNDLFSYYCTTFCSSKTAILWIKKLNKKITDISENAVFLQKADHKDFTFDIQGIAYYYVLVNESTGEEKRIVFGQFGVNFDPEK